MLKLGCTLPNSGNICLHSSTNHKFFPLVEVDKDLHVKICQDMTCGPTTVFTRKSVVDQTHIRSSGIICKSTMGVYASQIYLFSVSQEMPTGLYTGRELDRDFQKFKFEPKSCEKLRIRPCLIFNHNVQNAPLKAIIQLENRKILTVLAWMDFVLIATQFSMTNWGKII